MVQHVLPVTYCFTFCFTYFFVLKSRQRYTATGGLRTTLGSGSRPLSNEGKFCVCGVKSLSRQSITVSLYHCITVSLYHCRDKVSLYHCITVSLYHCITVSLYHCITVSLLRQSITVSLYHCRDKVYNSAHQPSLAHHFSLSLFYHADVCFFFSSSSCLIMPCLCSGPHHHAFCFDPLPCHIQLVCMQFWSTLSRPLFWPTVMPYSAGMQFWPTPSRLLFWPTLIHIQLVCSFGPHHHDLCFDPL